MLSEHPVTDDSYGDDPWKEYLDKWLLTRKDGLWLSDGIDRPPINTKLILLEQGTNVLELTRNKEKLMSLIINDTNLDKEIVVDGSWHSPDDIYVHITSALVSPKRSKALASQVIQENPLYTILPTFDEYNEEEEGFSSKEYIPWIVNPSTVARLDETDLNGGICAVRRPRITKKIVEALEVITNDPFGRNWKDHTGKICARSEAWGYHDIYDEGRDHSGTRLLCSHGMIKRMLATLNLELLILIKLKRYDKTHTNQEGKLFHTVAVVNIDRSINYKYFDGITNHLP